MPVPSSLIRNQPHSQTPISQDPRAPEARGSKRGIEGSWCKVMENDARLHSVEQNLQQQKPCPRVPLLPEGLTQDEVTESCSPDGVHGVNDGRVFSLYCRKLVRAVVMRPRYAAASSCSGPTLENTSDSPSGSEGRALSSHPARNIKSWPDHSPWKRCRASG
eukprot:CAMPEP_0184330784 /NCGR_PEP_ID=MMETSP1049-20130417/144864_1 /TAXON_ID=77928 /ORGANISM="Proteomonas sulcata, Strain CCMP704" /LENGTH=161 /DNA_ID=CAMNT_0026653237 /DNA_START=57 /DNA_END=543 /DNA_ORIENTATION=-